MRQFNNSKIIVVADHFAEDYVGGAELTTQALLDGAPCEIVKIRAIDLNFDMIQKLSAHLWIFGNFAQMKYTLIPEIIKALGYVVLEYDYKFCMHRSIDLHQTAENRPCDCHQYFGKTIANFFKNSLHVFWMSEAQRKIYEDRFITMREADGTVLSSVFSADDLKVFRQLRESDGPRTGWAYQASGSWIKGIEDAEKYCLDNDLQAKPIGKMKRAEFLSALRHSEGFVFMPKGGDSCPRVVIEAKLVGCKLALNEHVQNKDESWFSSSPEEVEKYLAGRLKVFWEVIKNITQNEGENRCCDTSTKTH